MVVQRVRFGMAAAMAFVALPAHAWQTRVLDAGACVAPLPPATPPLFVDGFDAASASWSRPSGGTGGAYPGNLTRSVYVPEVGAYRTYYVRIPPQYDPARAWPVVVGLHGAGGAGTSPAAANAVRATWAPLADASAFILVAPMASGASGGWSPGTDEAIIHAALGELEAAYNVERSREYLWGYSSGGHFGHGLALYDTGRWAAYGVNAGVLQAYAGVTAPNDAAATRRVPVSIRVGTTDPLVQYAQADRVRFANAGWVEGDTMTFGLFVGGHVYDATDAAATWQFACHYAVVP